MKKKTKNRGAIIGFVGPMNAHKTLLLLDHISAAKAVGEKVILYKPEVDDRFAKNLVCSRCSGSRRATPVPASSQGQLKAKSSFILNDVIKKHPKVNTIAIDEVEMFDDDIAEVVTRLVEMGKDVVFSGLNTNYRGEAFSNGTRDLIAICTRLEVLTARCTYSEDGKHKCGAPATMTQRLKNGEPDSYSSPLIVIEKFATKNEKPTFTYEARCLKHWSIKGKRKAKKLKYV
ncbi:Thymidine kinase [bioreactor metagenome]|uniref:thymidine kinase n=1 Tax=bioreactor metagenome TaxID=1076179 RepID=A0A644Y4A4_9ZZZZ